MADGLITRAEVLVAESRVQPPIEPACKAGDVTGSQRSRPPAHQSTIYITCEYKIAMLRA